jgi:hypothetical protein
MLTLLFIPFILALLFLGYYLTKKTISPFTADPPLPVLKKLYHQRLAEIEDVDKVLDRKITKGNENINTLKLLPEEIAYKRPDLKQDTTKQIFVNDSELKLIRARMKPGTDLIHNENGIFYWDKRFTTEPTPITFAYDPKKYIIENPTLFPSYEIYKNNHYFMSKEQRIPV